MTDPGIFEEMENHPISLSLSALHLAQAIAYPDLDVDLYLGLLDGLADWAIKAVPKSNQVRIYSGNLSAFLFVQLGFQGNRDHYDDPRNSFLNQVLDRRLGIPISLSLIYLHVAHRAGLDAHGIGLPGHFIVGVGGHDREIYIDPFNQGKVISPVECATLVSASTGYQGPFQEDWLVPAKPTAILTRVLNNLRNIYIEAREWDLALRVIEQTSLLHPSMPELVRDRGIIYQQQGKLSLAIQQYERYLSLRPDTPDAPAVQSYLRSVAKQLARRN